jgi:hypothetical protein
MRELLASVLPEKFLQRLVDQFSRTITMIPAERDILDSEFSLEQLLEISQN